MAEDKKMNPEVPSKAERDAAYDQIDRYLRNNLDDTDYADYSAALERVYGYSGPAQFTPGEAARGNVGIRWVTATNVAGRPTLHDVLDYLDGRVQEEDGSWELLDTAGGLAVRLLARMTEAPKRAMPYGFDRMHVGRRDPDGSQGHWDKLSTREIQRSPAFRTDLEWSAYAKQVCNMLNAAERAGRMMVPAQKNEATGT